MVCRVNQHSDSCLVTWLVIGAVTGGAVGFFTGAIYVKNRVAIAPAACEYNPATPEQRTWADLFAACELTDARLGADANGKPACYRTVYGQGAEP